MGTDEAESIDANVRDRILSRPRAKELRHTELPQMSLEDFREKFGGYGVSDDDALLNYFAGTENVAAMKAAGAAQQYGAAAAPLLALLEQLTAQKQAQSIEIERPSLKLRLRRL